MPPNPTPVVGARQPGNTFAPMVAAHSRLPRPCHNPTQPPPGAAVGEGVSPLILHLAQPPRPYTYPAVVGARQPGNTFAPMVAAHSRLPRPCHNPTQPPQGEAVGNGVSPLILHLAQPPRPYRR
jgi:hypothetical protein